MNALTPENQAVFNKIATYSKCQVVRINTKNQRKYSGGGGYIGVVDVRFFIGDVAIALPGIKIVWNKNAGAGIQMPSDTFQRNGETQYSDKFTFINAATRAFVLTQLWQDPQVVAAYQTWNQLPVPAEQPQATGGIPGMVQPQLVNSTGAPSLCQTQPQPQSVNSAPAANTGLPHNDGISSLLPNLIG